MNNEKNKLLTGSPDFSETIADIVKSNLAPKKMAEAIEAYHEKDIAFALDLLEKDDCQKLFRILSIEQLAAVFDEIENPLPHFEALSFRQKIQILSLMERSAAAELLQQLDKEECRSLLDLLEPDICKELCWLGSFDKEEIGSKMSTNFIEISDTSTIKEAMSQLIQQAAENDNLNMLYLVDSKKTFCGAIELKDLIIARENTSLADITTVSYPYVYANAAIEDCIPLLRNYAENSIPVLDDQNKLLGVVAAQNIVELLEGRLSDDYTKLGGLTFEEDLAEPLLQSVKKRIPWLCVLLLLGLGVSATVGLFESIVAQLPVIVCFQSLILDMAGNVGTQSLAVAIRVLMNPQIHRKEKLALVWKEMRIGLLNSSLLGLLSLVLIGIYLYLKGSSLLFSFAVSSCLGIAMVLAMVISSLSGTIIPILFKQIGVDPAVASGPLITTINDLVVVITYYGLSWLILLQPLQLG